MPYDDTELGQHCSGDGLLPDGTRPSPDPMLTQHYWHPFQCHFTENIWYDMLRKLSLENNFQDIFFICQGHQGVNSLASGRCGSNILNKLYCCVIFTGGMWRLSYLQHSKSPLMAKQSVWFSYTLSREYRVARYRYSRLLFTGEDRLCANLHVQWQ